LSGDKRTKIADRQLPLRFLPRPASLRRRGNSRPAFRT
jgi:hypothetical protein